ncbi:hypothetical protein ACH5RR_029947 [Cinchona calisaya]|uniref:Uncharacterized protein n=1 Tax=Cinchona calisaya TaxID=153742 RepID=A0ABD2YT48_9GENT
MSWEVPSMEEEAPGIYGLHFGDLGGQEVEGVCLIFVLFFPLVIEFIRIDPNFCGGRVHLLLLRERGKMNVCVCGVVPTLFNVTSLVCCEEKYWLAKLERSN